MFLIRINDNEPAVLPLNTILPQAVSQFGAACISNCDADEVTLLDVTVRHSKPVVNKVLATYKSAGL